MNLNLSHAKTLEELDFVEKNFYYKLGSSIRTYRRARNFSQEYMAAKLKISQNTYSKIEAGKCSCSVYRLMSILNLLDLDPQSILTAENNAVLNIEIRKI